MQLPWRSLHRPPARMPHSAWPPNATNGLLFLLLVSAVAQWSLSRLDPSWDALLARGELTADGLKSGRAWQVLTHLFLNDGPEWLLPVGFVTLALAGRPLEGIVGRRHLWLIFGLSGTAGGLGQAGFDALLGRDVPISGSASAVMGILLALAYVSPKTPLLPWAHPEALRRVKVVHGTLGALAATVVAGTHPPAAGAMVGGLTGCLYMHALGFGHWTSVEEAAPTVSTSSSASWRQRAAQSKTSTTAMVAKNAPALSRRTEPEQAMTAREFIAEKVDPVLEKISREGMSSLTAEERQVLETARDKVGRAK